MGVRGGMDWTGGGTTGGGTGSATAGVATTEGTGVRGLSTLGTRCNVVPVARLFGTDVTDT